jgi:Uma2 family endonuclease
MSSVPISYLTPGEYLELERLSDEKHEYWYGEMYAMACGSPAHSFLISNLNTAIGKRVQGTGCRTFNADLRFAVRWGTLITYPDITVISGPPNYVDDHRATVTNPTLVLEVLLPSTATKDRGDKTYLYRQAPSTREILLVEPTPVLVERYWKPPNGHREIETVTGPATILKLHSLDCELRESPALEH